MNRKFAIFSTVILAQSVGAIVVSDVPGLADSQDFASFLLGEPGYSATGWIEIQEGSNLYRGAGILLNNDWVLTAGHNWIANAITGLNFHYQGKTHTAIANSWIHHPNWSANPEVGISQGSDLGLFKLVSPIAGVAPTRIYNGSGELGATITLIGPGSAGIGSEGPRPNSTPLFFAGTNMIDRVIDLNGGGGLLAFDFDDGTTQHNTLSGSTVYDVSGIPVTDLSGITVNSQSSSASPIYLEATSAVGDSGVPAFADFGSGPELIGLVSWGVNPSEPANLYGSTYGDITYLTRISSSHDWIMGIIPEPHLFGYVLSGILFIITVYRKRR